MRSLLLSVPLFTSLATAIWPVPVSYEHGDTVLWITRDVEFFVHEAGATNVGSIANQAPFVFDYNSNIRFTPQDTLKSRKRDLPPFNKDGTGDDTGEVTGHDIIDYAINSAYTTILHRNFYPWKFHPRNWTEPSPNTTSTYVSRVDINLLTSDPVDIGKPPAGSADESYSLTLSTDGHASISANSSIGIARGLTTFTQLFYLHSSLSATYTPLAPLSIADTPKFPHRGINLDVSRNFFPVQDVLRQISTCAYNKMNRFHLHITDSQSWPLEIPSMPELSAKGAYRPDLVYTVDDLASIQRHGALQGVQVIVEIDMPGHTSVLHYSHPELIAAWNIQPDWSTYAAEPPSGTLKLNSSAVDAFLEKLLDDLLPRVYPYSSYFHTGGDEVNKKAYELDDTVGSSDVAVLQPLMQKFVDRNHEQVRKRGLTPVVWEEMLLDWNLTLGSDVIVQSWQSDEAVAQIVERGHKVLVGNYNYWYLDCGKGEWLNFAPSTAGDAWPYNDYCAPFHNWRLIYSYDPLSGIPEENQHLVLGGEAHLWTEQSDPTNLDRMLWPRGSAAAEILWSGAKDPQNGGNRSQIEASGRLSEMRERLVGLGVGAESIQMPFCTMEGGCNL
ncbi:glycoside hydrolase family 20 protein [Plenodomus tracheiphilus IPT5]|uniref:Beta-hexosaminidase n=1 Tax=Plenodomus tracheiphilus IPT5 TaxID=1408161 RepID=A0A6A7B691_9PLEO|nr:glycoside hydrolase family 20 protein [Plenodomus tracheiphilus IPT5]